MKTPLQSKLRLGFAFSAILLLTSSCDTYTPANMAGVFVTEDRSRDFRIELTPDGSIDDGNGVGTFEIKGDKITAKVNMYVFGFKIVDKDTLEVIATPRYDLKRKILKRVR